MFCTFALPPPRFSGIIHRDIKPDNIMLTQHDTIKLVDFGIAVRVADSFPSRSNTPAYHPPETSVLTFAYDVWSVGITALELFNEKLPPRLSCTFNQLLGRITGNTFDNLIEGIPDLVAVNSEANSK